MIDENDKPVAGAEVGWIEGDEQQTRFMTTCRSRRTDAGGYFRFPHVRPGQAGRSGQGEGHAPEIKPLDEIDMAGHLTVKLGRRAHWQGASLIRPASRFPTSS